MLSTKRKLLIASLCIIFTILIAILLNTIAMNIVKDKHRNEIKELDQMNYLMSQNGIINNTVSKDSK